MTKNTKTDAKTKPATRKSDNLGVPTARVPKANSASRIKKLVSDKAGAPNHAVSPVVSSPVTDDPMMSALLAHEREIARLGALIIELRGQQVSWLNANIGEQPRVMTPSTVDEFQASQDEIARLTESLGQAWAELETKQAYLQAAVDDGVAVQASLDGATAQFDQLVEENQALKDQLKMTTKRLNTALEVISRRGYS